MVAAAPVERHFRVDEVLPDHGFGIVRRGQPVDAHDGKLLSVAMQAVLRGTIETPVVLENAAAVAAELPAVADRRARVLGVGSVQPVRREKMQRGGILVADRREQVPHAVFPEQRRIPPLDAVVQEDLLQLPVRKGFIRCPVKLHIVIVSGFGKHPDLSAVLEDERERKVVGLVQDFDFIAPVQQVGGLSHVQLSFAVVADLALVEEMQESMMDEQVRIGENRDRFSLQKSRVRQETVDFPAFRGEQVVPLFLFDEPDVEIRAIE